MGFRTRVTALITILAAVGFGLLGALDGVPDFYYPGPHFFLFNLTLGGALVLVHVSGRKGIGPWEAAYFAAGAAFSAGAFIKAYWISIAASVFMAVLVERARWRRFSWFPKNFFTNAPASEKFSQAALLCLSLGLLMCAATLANAGYLHLFDYEKLDVHVFFLGFSFHISLAAYGMIFERLEGSGRPPGRLASEFCFWALNLGVVTFFVFIVLEVYAVQFAMALLLFSVVIVTIYFHWGRGRRGQEGLLLSSALVFLTVGSLSGISYILVLWKGLTYSGYLLSFHSAANVFGWNMAFLMLALRKGHFPLKVSPWPLICLHWMFVFLLPLGRSSVYFGAPGLVFCAALLGLGLFASSAESEDVDSE